MQLSFYGAAGVVTGSKHLLTTPGGHNILLDCGLFQGKISQRTDLNHHFGFSPLDIDTVILSHAHIDHSGLLPRLVREGFSGKILATPATISLCEIMLYDSAHIQEDDLKYVNERRKRKGEPLLEVLYDTEDVKRTLRMMHPVDYEQPYHICDDATFTFTDAGHLLGSAAVHIDLHLKKQQTLKLTFSGDIGRYGDSILNDPQAFRQCDILICESTYGNRLHPAVKDAQDELLRIVRHTCVEKKGKLVIPAFSVDRTQEIVYLLDQMSNEGLLPNIKVYVDSPLSVKATEVIRKHRECYNPTFIDYIKKDPDPFGFKNLTYVSQVEDSKRINLSKEPCIIISASGMAEAGRIKHHIKNTIENSANTILIVGYCTPESLGGRLKNGDKEVRIFGEEYTVKAQVESLDYYSAHADYNEIFKWLTCQDLSLVKKIFLVHGETDAQEYLRDLFIGKGVKAPIVIPQLFETHRI